MSGGIISINPKLGSADAEYSPAQRLIIDAQLAEAAKGHTYGPFTATQATRFLKAEIKSRRRRNKKTR